MRQADRQTDRQTGRRVGRPADSHSDRRTDGQTEGGRERERERERLRDMSGHEIFQRRVGGAAIIEPIVIIPIRHRPSVPPSFPSSSNRVQQRETLSGRIDCPPSVRPSVHEWPNSVNSGFSLKLSISARSALHCSPLPPCSAIGTLNLSSSSSCSSTNPITVAAVAAGCCQSEEQSR